MGLFTGMSVLSVIELIFWLALMCSDLGQELHVSIVGFSRNKKSGPGRKVVTVENFSGVGQRKGSLTDE